MKNLRMKIGMVLLVLTTLSITISSCHRGASCPTYSGSKGFR